MPTHAKEKAPQQGEKVRAEMVAVFAFSISFSHFFFIFPQFYLLCHPPTTCHFLETFQNVLLSKIKGHHKKWRLTGFPGCLLHFSPPNKRYIRVGCKKDCSFSFIPYLSPSPLLQLWNDQNGHGLLFYLYKIETYIEFLNTFLTLLFYWGVLFY